MRLIKPSTVKVWAKQTPLAESFLLRFIEIVQAQEWDSLVELRKTYPHADAVRISNGKTVTVFNVGKTGYRLVTAIHYNSGRMFVLCFMKHSEYEAGKWKEQL